MRINKFVAQATGLSRRGADQAIEQGRVKIGVQIAKLGDSIKDGDLVMLDGHPLAPAESVTIMFNKPAGYVCSRQGQGSQTVYDLLPSTYQHLKPIGRLDKDSSGLLLLTNDGNLANELTHPSHSKTKIYEVELNRPLASKDYAQIEQGIELEDGTSRLNLLKLNNPKCWQVTMSEGRNRQIRRTFATLGYQVTKLHRTNFGPYNLGALKEGKYN